MNGLHHFKGGNSEYNQLPSHQQPYTNRDDYTMTVEGRGMVTAAPDQALLSIGAVTNDLNLQTAQQENTSIINRIIGAIRQAGVGEDDIKTTVYSVNPRYDFVEGNSIFRGYEVEHQLQITAKDLTKVGMIYDIAIQGGANRTGTIQFQNSHADLHYLQALTMAVHDAFAKAQQIALTIGVSLIRIPLRITENPQLFTPAGVETFAFAAKGPAAPIEPGEMTINARVYIVFQYNL